MALTYLVWGQGGVSRGVSLLVYCSFLGFASIMVVRLGLVHLGQILCPWLLDFFELIVHLFLLFDLHH